MSYKGYTKSKDNPLLYFIFSALCEYDKERINVSYNNNRSARNE